MPIIVCLPSHHPLLRRLGDLALAGADRVVTLDAPDDEADLRRDAQQAMKRELPLGVDLKVDATVVSRGIAAELWCARNGYLSLNERLLEAHLGVDRSTILRGVTDEGWRDVQHVMRASRTLHVAAELDRSAAPVAIIARRLRLGSASALHHRIRRATARSAQQLRFAGALQIAVALWRSRGKGV